MSNTNEHILARHAEGHKHSEERLMFGRTITKMVFDIAVEQSAYEMDVGTMLDYAEAIECLIYDDQVSYKVWAGGEQQYGLKQEIYYQLGLNNNENNYDILGVMEIDRHMCPVLAKDSEVPF